MRMLKNIFSQLHRFILWALILSVFWSWVYTKVGDSPPQKKVVFYVDAYAMDPRPLSLLLEDTALPEGLKMIQARSTGYDIFGGEMHGDFYIVKGSTLRAVLEETPDKLTPIELPALMEGFVQDGLCWGIRAFNAETQQGVAMAYIQYAPYPEPQPEDLYLCFDAASLHLASNSGAIDNAAWEVAQALLAMRD